VTTRIIDDREAGLIVGYNATDWVEPMSFDNYQELVKDWGITAIERDGQVIGAVYRKGDELHVSVLPQWRRLWVTKGVLRQLFSPPKVTTRVTPGHEFMFDILRRLGFKDTNGGLLVKER